MMEKKSFDMGKTAELFERNDTATHKESQEHNPGKMLQWSTVRSALWNRYLPWVVLLSGLIVTAFAVLYVKANIEKSAEHKFVSLCEEIQQVISNRLDDHARILLSGAALFNSSDEVKRKEWRIFSQYQKLEKQLPGIQGFGFSLLIPREELDKHVQEIRNEGFPDYSVKPGGDREIYAAIIFLEPFSGRNLRAFGYDMLTEPVRRAAMERARDTDSAALSGKVVLVQETDKDVQAGALMYVPVYRKGMPTDSVEQRRVAIYGWVYSPYRMNDLMRGILGTHFYNGPYFSLNVYDGGQVSPESLLYASPAETSGQDLPAVRFKQQVPINFGGHQWTLSFSLDRGGFFAAEYLVVWLVMFGGVIVTALLFSLIHALLSTNIRSQRMAERLTSDLRDSEEKFAAIANYTVDWEIWFTKDGKIFWTNPSMECITGYTVTEVMEMPDFISILIAPEDRGLFIERFQAALQSGERDEFDLRYARKNGSKAWLNISWQTISDAKGVSLGLRASGRDVTERKLADFKLREKTAFLSGLLRSIPDIVFFKGLDGVYLGCNPEFARLVNRSEAEIVGLTDYELFGKETSDFFREQDRIMMEQGKPRHNEEYIRYPDGEPATIDTFKAPLKDIDGRLIGILGVSRNITEQKLTEEALREKTALLEAQSNAIIDGILVIDKNQKRIFSNQRILELFNVPPHIIDDNDDTALLKHVGSLTKHPAQFLEKVEYLYAHPSESSHDEIEFKNGMFLERYSGPVLGKGGKNYGRIWSFRDITVQKQLEDKIRSSEKNFRTFFQTVDDIIVVGSVDGRILFANQAFTSKLGYASEELENFRILDMHPEEKRKEAEEIFGAMLRGERDFCPLPLQAKDGRYLPVETRIWFGRWNEADCIFGISKDLSVQQAALEKFEKIFRSNPALVAISSTTDKKFIEVNDSFLKRLGFTRDEVIGKTAVELKLFANPNLQEKVACELESQGQVRSVELKVRDKAGLLVDGLFSGEIIDNQGEKVFLTVMTDLTDLKKAEALLFRNVEMKKLLMELSSQYINIPLNEVDSAIQSALGKMGKFVSSDRAYVFSYDFERGIMSNDYEWCDAGIEPQIDNLKEVPLDLAPDWVSTHRKGQYMHIEDVSTLPHGGLKETLELQGIKSLLAVPMMSDNECVGFVGFDSVNRNYAYTDKEISLLYLFSQMLVNVKSRVKTEKNLIEANSLLKATNAKVRDLAKQAMSANTAKSRFLAHMSHEIRTPLNAILGFSQLMQYDLELSPSQKQRVDTINRSGKHLLNLLNDILELSKIEAGNLSVTSVSFDLHCLINDVLLLFRSRMEDKNLTTAVYDLEKVPKYLVADEQKLRQVIINLLSNAVKYTVSGGVSLRVNVQDGGPDATRLVILVEDTGPGITAEEMEQLFLPFEQTSTGRKSGTGSGLGLAISRQFARIMGGDVTVVSELGKGSVFRFDIPVKTGAAQSDTGNRRVLRLEAGQPKFRILIAEDDNDSKNFLVQMLDNIGFEVLQVSNGNEAVEAFISGKPQLILMDDSMPVMRGDEAIRLIRKSPGGASVKILALTANASEETRQRFITAGTDDFMAKPFSQSDLFEKIRILSGIRYVYSDSCKEERITQESVPVLTKEEMDSLPADLRQQIRAATISCRHDQLLKLIQQVTEIAPETGETLRNMALRFDYNALIKLLN